MEILERTVEKAKPESLRLEETFAGFGVLRIPVLVEEWINDLVPVVDLVQRRVTSLNEFKESAETRITTIVSSLNRVQYDSFFFFGSECDDRMK